MDVVGDRWTLLIVRELLIRKECRYTDLKAGLPGIASNLLAERLREMEASGIVKKEDAPPPVATALFSLTERGAALEPVLDELGRWGAPLLKDAPKSDACQGHWLALPAKFRLKDRAPKEAPVEIELRSGGETVVIEAGGSVRTRVGKAEKPGAVLEGTARVVAAVLLGKMELREAKKAGLVFRGDVRVLERVLGYCG